MLNVDSNIGFFEGVYQVVKLVPFGKVITYGQIAKILGAPKMSRQVGWALHKNPDPNTIPCYRVVNRFGATSEAFAFGGQNRQIALLKAEGITFDNNGLVNKIHFMSI